MKEYKNLLAVAALVIFMVPQVALAAWWNPISWSVWNIFRPTPKVQQVQIKTATTTGATTTQEKSAKQDVIAAPKNTKIEQSKPKAETKTTPKTKTTTLPNGSVVELDADGNFLRFIKEAPAATGQSTQPTQGNSTKISSTALESELLKFLNEQLSQQTKSDLDYYQRTISDLQSLNQMQAGISSSGKQNCLTSYNSKVKYAKDDAQRQKTANAEAQRGFASSPAISQNIDAQLVRDLEDIENWYNSCLAQYQADSSVSGRLSQVSSQLSGLRQRVNSGGTVSTSEVSAVGNEIVSISRALGEVAGVSGSVSLPSVGSRPSSITCTNDITGFSCRDNFGSNAMRCTQSTPGFLNCTDSNFNSVSCQSNSTLGSLRCSW
ncbi:hypothetical protein HY949_00625 [Candidatus Gottesmanbacteria bacterium]|nr:hypothetical protein [Candidatus Gottesmanbacteria bacterium]